MNFRCAVGFIITNDDFPAGKVGQQSPVAAHHAVTYDYDSVVGRHEYRELVSRHLVVYR